VRAFKKRNRAEWKKIVAEQQSSGLSAREFCKQRNLQEGRFYSWRKVLSPTLAIPKEMSVNREMASVEFVPITVKKGADKPALNPLSASSARVDIFLHNGNVVRINGGMSEDQLVSLLTRLEESSC
jgi:hypothetical protein